jgi:alcohol dehydrogenase (NADP+)
MAFLERLKEKMAEHTLETTCYDAQTKSFVHKSTLKTLGPNDVWIRTTHSGLCATDVHAKETGCGLGHEGVGFVEAVGNGVSNLKVGERVGWGWLHSVSFILSSASIISALQT